MSGQGYQSANAAGGFSGGSYDRWVESNSHPPSNPLGKVTKQFWFTKSAVMRKFGKGGCFFLFVLSCFFLYRIFSCFLLSVVREVHTFRHNGDPIEGPP